MEQHRHPVRLASAFPVAAGDLNYRGGMRCNAVQALAWRLGRQCLDPIPAVPTTEVVRRLLALRGWPEEGSDLAVCVRQADPDPGGVGRALDAGEMIRKQTITYNRTRQAMITKELIEIISGAILPSSIRRPTRSEPCKPSAISVSMSASFFCTSWVAASGRPNCQAG